MTDPHIAVAMRRDNKALTHRWAVPVDHATDPAERARHAHAVEFFLFVADELVSIIGPRRAAALAQQLADALA